MKRRPFALTALSTGRENVSGLQRTEKVQQVLLLRLAEALEQSDDGVRFGAISGMRLNCIEQAAVLRRCATVVEEKDPLTESPERGGAELVGSGRALRDVVSEAKAHVMNKQIRVERNRLIA